MMLLKVLMYENQKSFFFFIKTQSLTGCSGQAGYHREGHTGGGGQAPGESGQGQKQDGH